MLKLSYNKKYLSQSKLKQLYMIYDSAWVSPKLSEKSKVKK